MASKPQVTAKVSADSSDIQKGLDAGKAKFASFAKGVGAQMRSAITGAVAGAMTAATAAMAASMKAGLAQAITAEQSEIVMKAMLGSADKAKGAIMALNAEVAKNPMFSKGDMYEAAQGLVGFADKSVPKLMSLVRLAERLRTLKPQAGLMGAAEALRDAIGGETERLKEYGFSGKELSKMKADAGSGADLSGAIGKALDAKGINGAAMRDMSMSFEAQISALKNQFVDIGQDMAMAVMPDVQKAMGEISAVIVRNKDEIAKGIATLIDLMGKTVQILEKAFGGVDKVTNKVAETMFPEKTPGLDAAIARRNMGARQREILEKNNLPTDGTADPRMVAKLRIDVQGANGLPKMMANS